MTHFLDILDPTLDVPPAARRIADYFGRIVGSGTIRPLRPAVWRETALACRRRPGRKPCAGHLRIRLQIISGIDGVGWACSECGDNGFVYNFRGTPWDRSARLSTRRDRQLQVILSRPEYKALLDEVWSEQESEGTILLAETTDNGVLLSGSEQEIDELATELAAVLRNQSLRGHFVILDKIFWKLERSLRDAKKRPQEQKIINLADRRKV